MRNSDDGDSGSHAESESGFPEKIPERFRNLRELTVARQPRDARSDHRSQIGPEHRLTCQALDR